MNGIAGVCIGGHLKMSVWEKKCRKAEVFLGVLATAVVNVARLASI